MFICVYILHRLNPPLGTKLDFFSIPIFISISRFLVLAKAFRNDHKAAWRTALRSAIDMNEMGDYVKIPCSSQMTQRSSRVDWPNF